RMDEFLGETGKADWIENSAQPLDNNHVTRRIPHVRVIGKPNFQTICHADIQRDQLRAQRKRVGWEEPDSGVSLDGIENRRARIRCDADDSFEAVDAERSL